LRARTLLPPPAPLLPLTRVPRAATAAVAKLEVEAGAGARRWRAMTISASLLKVAVGEPKKTRQLLVPAATLLTGTLEALALVMVDLLLRMPPLVVARAAPHLAEPASVSLSPPLPAPASYLLLAPCP